MEKNWDIIIIGGGPAGLAAAVYCGRSLRRTLVVEKRVLGGQIVDSDIIENYPGFVEPQVPFDLMDEFVKQAGRYGVQFTSDEVSAIVPVQGGWRVDLGEDSLSARALIMATGSAHRYLEIPGEKEFLGRGVSVCATCDAPFYREKTVAVVGGGDTALTEALHLTKFAAEVHLIHRRDKFRGEKILQERVLRHEKIKVHWNSVVVAVQGERNLESLLLRRVSDDERSVLPVHGFFIAIGTDPNTALLHGLADLDEQGYVRADFSLATKSPGLFVAGEIIAGHQKQVAVSVGSGSQAALNCEEYLSALE